jgi:hypothetical protein
MKIGETWAFGDVLGPAHEWVSDPVIRERRMMYVGPSGNNTLIFTALVLNDYYPINIGTVRSDWDFRYFEKVDD